MTTVTLKQAREWGEVEAKVLAYSIAADHLGPSIVTLQLRYPRFIHAEFMTHRVFSRNASSSRAVPVDRVLQQVRDNPVMPLHWGVNQKGMQALAELEGFEKERAVALWRSAAFAAASHAGELVKVNAHKQVVNRILEPFVSIHVVVTSTEWANFFALRCHAAAQPEMQALALMMQHAIYAFADTKIRNGDGSDARCWHLPYVSEEERLARNPLELAKVSAARCARVSYNKHDGTPSTLEEDLALFYRLVGQHPIHASPSEHQAWPMVSGDSHSRNFRGWWQHRQVVESTSSIVEQLSRLP